MLALSGGADSSASATIMGALTYLLFDAVKLCGQRNGREEEESNGGGGGGGGGGSEGERTMTHVLVNDIDRQSKSTVLEDLRRVCGFTGWSVEKGTSKGNPSWLPSSPQEIAFNLLHSAYMGTVNSSGATRKRAADLAKEIGMYHIDTVIDPMVSSMTQGTRKGRGRE